MKLPLLSARELIRFLQNIGFVEIRQRGSHRIFRHADGRTTIVPVHAGRDIGRGLLRRIIDEIGMERDEFLRKIRR